MDRRAALDTDSAIVLLRGAIDADPSYFPPHFDYINLLGHRGAIAKVRREYAVANRALMPHGDCIDAVLAAPFSTMSLAVPALERLEQQVGPAACTDVYLAQLLRVDDPATAQRSLAHGARAVRVAPELADSWNSYASAFAALGRNGTADSVTQEGIARVSHRMARLVLLTHDVVRRRAVGDSLGAAIRMGEVTRLGREGAEPGMRLQYLYLLGRRSYRETLRIARAAGSKDDEYSVLEAEATSRFDVDGNPTTALALLQQVVALSAHLGPQLQSWAHTRRGRVFLKMGRLQLAKRDLREAIRIAEVIGEPYVLGEAYHNLAHAFEEQGDWLNASRAAERFVVAFRPLPDGGRVVALRDAAIIRWKAGWHAASQRTFEEMVRAIDERKRDNFWAGEYFEREGDLRRALEYYRRGVRESEVAQNWAGLARVYDALGIRDSAEIAARRHDALPGIWQDGLLLPKLLARNGRLEEAARLSRKWSSDLLASENIEGAVVALMDRAELLLDGHQPVAALADAALADSHATSLHQTDKTIRARMLRGSALLALGDTLAGVELLRHAANLAARHPTTDGVRATQLALAGALAGSRRLPEAIAAYDLAARAVESVSHRLSTDLDRTRYRDGQLAAFNGALVALLRAPNERSQLEPLVHWSQRRKGAALALAIGFRAVGARRRSGTYGSARIRESVLPDEALIDFITVDSLVAALVFRRTGVTLVRLAISADSVRRLADAVQRPFRASKGGSIDITRAKFDLSIAATLYRCLVSPLEPTLTGVTRLLLSPDGPLHAVPFEALVSAASNRRLSADEALASARFLIDRYEVAYVPSAYFALRRTRQKSAPLTGELLALGFEAPGAERELAVIESSWRGTTRLLYGESATETALRGETGAAIAHFATHAVADDKDPLASHLRVAGDSENDGLLHVPEIAALRMSARLVVLSGCETLIGRLFEGEGFLGLARAFLAGGAESVVATQWPIGGATAELMAVFYARLAVGHDPVRALHEAKIDVRRRTGMAHPFYWAGFVVIVGG